jgi:hypothetical protein
VAVGYKAVLLGNAAIAALASLLFLLLARGERENSTKSAAQQDLWTASTASADPAYLEPIK